MIKLVALLKKRDDITRETFIAHYENSHIPLIMGFFEPFVVERQTERPDLRVILRARSNRHAWTLME